MNPVTILVISWMVGAAAITVLLAAACLRYEKEHPDEYDEWEDITDDRQDD